MTRAELAEKKKTLDVGYRALVAWEALLIDVANHLARLRARVSICEHEYAAAEAEQTLSGEKAA